jgi:tetratricopeptide (TPR) repeat protein
MSKLDSVQKRLDLLSKISESKQEKFKLFLINRFREKNDSQQIDSLESGLEKITEYPNFFNLLGNFYQKDRDFKNAFQCYQMTLEENPDDYWANLHLATIYRQYLIDRQLLDLNLKRQVIIDKVIEIYDRLLLKHPDDKKCLRFLGKFYGNIGKSERSIPINRHLAEIIQSQPSNLSSTQSSFSPKNLLRFLVIGSMKSGTTSLFEAIGSHPDFVKPIVKEIQFFSLFIERGYEWYFSHFPQRDKPYFTGESSTSSFDYLQVPERIAASDLDLKFIVILRNPIDRVISNFYHLKSHHNLKGRSDFNQTISEQLNLLDPYRNLLIEMASGESAINSSLPIFQDYNQFFIMRSLYSIFIRNWLNFFPQEKMLILKLQEFTEKPHLHLSKIYDFLEVSQPKANNYQPHRANVGTYKPDQLSPQLKERLVNFLKPFNRILNKDFQLKF